MRTKKRRAASVHAVREERTMYKTNKLKKTHTNSSTINGIKKVIATLIVEIARTTVAATRLCCCCVIDSVPTNTCIPAIIRNDIVFTTVFIIITTMYGYRIKYISIRCIASKIDSVYCVIKFILYVIPIPMSKYYG